MRTAYRKILAVVACLGLALALSGCGGLIVDGKADAPIPSGLLNRIKAIGSTPGAAMMMRIFKKDSVLEVWKQTSSGKYALLTTYKICAWSGGFGPKIAEGDRQAPEGFYSITAGLLNPHSNYYLAFNTGYPNKFDQAYGRTGSNLMIHGDCSSSGCYAMTDAEIAEIYSLARESLKGGNQSVQLEIFPFRMTPDNLARVSANPNMSFWRNIKTGYDQFELTKVPPRWDVCDKKYVFNATSLDGAALDPTAACPALKTDAGLVAAVSAKQAADNIAFQTALAQEQANQAAEAKAASDAAASKAAIAARGKAIGGFFGGLFGGGNTASASVAASSAPEPAPVPMPTLKRT